MAEDGEGKEKRAARRPAAEGARAAARPDADFHTAPTVSSAQAQAEHTQPTCIDPAAPIHHGAPAAATAASQPASRNLVALPAGYVLHEFSIVSVLGSGGFGITYLARDNNLQCEVAIKEYLPTDLAVRTAGRTVCARTEAETHGYRIGLERFLAEARVLASFRHRNIVRVTRFFEANNTAYMVMDYERGLSLRDWLKQHGEVDEAQLLKMFLPLLDGLEVVHRAGVVHRDIKPANIYVREEDGSLVLLDFGAARYAGTLDSRSLTTMVTPGFAPLEQYHTHGAQGPWSDLYAFGGVLYWMVTGQKPIEAPSRAKQDTMPTALALAGARYGERLLRAIDWALTPDETERPKSVSQFRAALTAEGEIAPPPRPTEVPRSRPARMLLFGLAGVALAAALAVLLHPAGPKSEPAAASPQRPAAADTAASPPAPTPATTRQAAAAPKAQRKKPAAAEAKATVLLKIVPQGEIVLDGRKLGTSPPLTRLQLPAGTTHRLEIHGRAMNLPHYWTLKLEPGETREISANFER